MKRALVIIILFCSVSVFGLEEKKKCATFPDWVLPAWAMAQRESRRSLPGYYNEIDHLKMPKVIWTCGPFEVNKQLYAGITVCPPGKDCFVVVGVVGDQSEDFATLVHEFQHSIAFQLPLTESQLKQNEQWVDLNWRWGSK